MDEEHYAHSTLRERIVEHFFIGEVLRALWKKGVTDVEILRSEFDAHGYDIVMTCGVIVRHIQLKTQGSARVSVNRALADKPSGCIVHIDINRDTLVFQSFRWFGSLPGQRLPDIAHYPNPKRATHKANGIRPPRVNHHLIPSSVFVSLASIDEVVTHLFGDLQSGAVGPAANDIAT